MTILVAAITICLRSVCDNDIAVQKYCVYTLLPVGWESILLLYLIERFSYVDNLETSVNDLLYVIICNYIII